MSAPEETVSLVTLEDIYRSREVIADEVLRTPLLPSRALSALTGADVWIKAENLQVTGSFKIRGAITAVNELTPEEREAGVIAVSAGNHGAAVAYAAQRAGVHATIVVPETAVQTKVDLIRSYGADLRPVDPMRLLENLEEIQAQQGSVFTHPFNRPAMIAGSGTLGLEILEDLPDIEVIVAGVGGGGLISGIAGAVAALRPVTRVVGVEPSGSNVVGQSLAAGKPVRLERFSTIADGLNAPWSAPLALAMIERFVDAMVTVSDEEIARALLVILDRTKLVIEPAAAAGLAGILSGAAGDVEGKRVVLVLSGGNMDLSRLPELMSLAGR